MGLEAGARYLAVEARPINVQIFNIHSMPDVTSSRDLWRLPNFSSTRSVPNDVIAWPARERFSRGERVRFLIRYSLIELAENLL